MNVRWSALTVAACMTLVLGCAAYGTHDASDPEYGKMYKDTTRARVSGTEYWGTRTDKSRNCTVGTMVQVCASGPPEASNPD